MAISRRAIKRRLREGPRGSRVSVGHQSADTLGPYCGVFVELFRDTIQQIVTTGVQDMTTATADVSVLSDTIAASISEAKTELEEALRKRGCGASFAIGTTVLPQCARVDCPNKDTSQQA